MVYDTTTLHQNFKISILIFLALFRVEQSDDPKGTFLKNPWISNDDNSEICFVRYVWPQFQSYGVETLHAPSTHEGFRPPSFIWGVKKSYKEAFFEVVTEVIYLLYFSFSLTDEILYFGIIEKNACQQFDSIYLEFLEEQVQHKNKIERISRSIFGYFSRLGAYIKDIHRTGPMGMGKGGTTILQTYTYLIKMLIPRQS